MRVPLLGFVKKTRPFQAGKISTFLSCSNIADQWNSLYNSIKLLLDKFFLRTEEGEHDEKDFEVEFRLYDRTCPVFRKCLYRTSHRA